MSLMESTRVSVRGNLKSGDVSHRKLDMRSSLPTLFESSNQEVYNDRNKKPAKDLTTVSTDHFGVAMNQGSLKRTGPNGHSCTLTELGKLESSSHLDQRKSDSDSHERTQISTFNKKLTLASSSTEKTCLVNKNADISKADHKVSMQVRALPRNGIFVRSTKSNPVKLTSIEQLSVSPGASPVHALERRSQSLSKLQDVEEWLGSQHKLSKCVKLPSSAPPGYEFEKLKGGDDFHLPQISFDPTRENRSCEQLRNVHKDNKDGRVNCSYDHSKLNFDVEGRISPHRIPRRAECVRHSSDKDDGGNPKDVRGHGTIGSHQKVMRQNEECLSGLSCGPLDTSPFKPLRRFSEHFLHGSSSERDLNLANRRHSCSGSSRKLRRSDSPFPFFALEGKELSKMSVHERSQEKNNLLLDRRDMTPRSFP